jgi:NAD-dependent deacetylase
VRDVRIAELADRIRGAARLTVLTGAGVSSASGVPTFRGAEGLWRRHRPEELATPDAFMRDPVMVWEWYAWRRGLVGTCAPNAAHDVIARWSQRTDECRVITQNVDDLHVRAGTRHLVRLHGSLWELSCAGPSIGGRCTLRACPAGARPWRDDRVPLPEMPPRCPHCGGLARPAVVWFGEALAEPDVDAARRATYCDVFLTVGTSAVVYPAASLVHEARRHGAFTAEINLEATPASSLVELAVQDGAERVLPLIDDLMTM